MPDHDILRGSHAWERLQQGIPPEIQDPMVRRMFHDYANVVTILVASINGMHDVADRHVEAAAEEHLRIHQRIDRRGEEHEKLRDRLLDGENGSIVKLDRSLRTYIDGKTGKSTALLLTVLGGIVVGCIMLAINLTTGR